jgi:hypothetical protein
MMPGLIPPEFNIEKEISSNEIILLYGSKRPGLSPMVSGLLEGLALRYNVQNLNVSPLGKTPDEAYERFLVKWN